MMANGRRPGGSGASIWSSHPPLEERIRRLRAIGSTQA
jgi:Zn-dependent protease with chaperone function